MIAIHFEVGWDPLVHTLLPWNVLLFQVSSYNLPTLDRPHSLPMKIANQNCFKGREKTDSSPPFPCSCQPDHHDPRIAAHACQIYCWSILFNTLFTYIKKYKSLAAVHLIPEQASPSVTFTERNYTLTRLLHLKKTLANNYQSILCCWSHMKASTWTWWRKESLWIFIPTIVGQNSIPTCFRGFVNSHHDSSNNVGKWTS